ncbi:MAG: HAMP domain-containing histidine kinase [Bacteroidales bacterium]|nr:HAMP domain-containing histidine kinase [Bacteroidales bacterium]MBN2761491.1 HAMP domain-containing histidine kinase [Bacteroidales bacterium]
MELEKLIDHMSAENDEIQAAFFRNLYHEIRTPMNSILGFSSLLHNENLTTEKRNIYTDQIWKSSVVFLQFIDDLVEASLLETHKTKLQPAWFSVSEMFQEVYKSSNRYRHILGKNDVALLLNIPQNLQEVCAETDRKRLQQLLEYLVTNCMTSAERCIIELGYMPILNNALSFFIKNTPVGYKNNNHDEHVPLRRVGVYSDNYGQIRKRMADRLLNLFGGVITTNCDDNGTTTVKIVFSPLNVSTNGIISDNKTNEKRMAI